MKIFKWSTYVFMCLFCSSMFCQYNYGEALQKSIFFYEAQQSGQLPSWNRVSWRGDSALGDGSDVGKELTGGWYDAGDHVKFGFPMAASATVLAWGVIEYEEAYARSGQLIHIKRNLRFVCDYFIKAHTAPNEFYGQLGGGGPDHAWWGSAEVMQMERPAFKIDAANPGSDLAGETAAALAAASIVFADSDPAYSATLLSHAKELYSFADNYRGKYSDAITDAVTYYNSWSGYQDEIVWGAAWLYRATGDASYLAKAETEYAFLGNEGQSDVKAYKWGLAWDDKSYGSYVLMSQLTGDAKYKTDAERHLDFWTTGYNGERIAYSPGGQAHLTQWGSNRHAANTSFIALVYSDKVATPKATTYHDFAVNQMNYILGDNPNNRSYMIGFGNNAPKNPHHRTAHGTWTNNLTGAPTNNRHTLYGALVGGPSSPNDAYVDDRGDFIANEVACDYNACFTGALARMYDEFGGNALRNFPVLEVPSEEFLADSKFNSSNPSGVTISVQAKNHTAWPARTTENLSFRYFFTISEAIAQGFDIGDYDISLSYAEGNGILSVNAWDQAAGIYYAEVAFPGELIAPIGESPSRREAQINIRVANGMPWDTTNDYSATGLTTGNDRFNSPYIPIYENGVLVHGNEPGDGPPTTNRRPLASFSNDLNSGLAPVVVQFDGTGSSDPDGDDLTYSWDFGNGQTSSLENPEITFEAVGSYLVSLTVSDGVLTSNEATATITVTDDVDPPTNTAPVAMLSASQTSGEAPLVVGFDASGSSDADGDTLSYRIDYGDGNSGSGMDSSHTYTVVGSYIAVVTVTDGKGGSDTDSIEISVTDGVDPPTGDCTFGTPTSSALPSVNTAFNTIYVIGNGGPNLSNVTNLTINWDAENNGLYQLSMITNNGAPTWWNDLLPKVNHSFDSAQPAITITGSGFEGLDGVYYAAIDAGNFVLVSQTAGFTIYFSTSTTAPACDDTPITPENTAPVASLLGTPLMGTEPLTISFDASGSTDADGDTLTYSFDFGDGTTGSGVTSTHVYAAGDYTATVTVSDGNGGSDTASVVIQVDEDGIVTIPSGECTFNTPTASALASVNVAYGNIYVLGSGGPSLDNVTTFTINWNAENNGLYQLSMNTDNGAPNWYVDLLPSSSQNFNAAQPAITLNGSGFAGLDGAYYATVDAGNFVLVSQTADFTLYFSTSTIAPDCEGTTGGENTDPVAALEVSTTSGDAPLVVSFDASGSSDADGDTLGYSIDYGDGTSGTGAISGHTYGVAGNYMAIVTVTDGNGGSDTDSVTITVTDVGTPPPPPPSTNNEYLDRFTELRNEIYDPANGYFSADGSPHHSVETLIVEAPDYGHESTSELYSYWMWLEAMHGRISGDWAPLSDVWEKTEQFIIPTKADQPTNAAYSPSSPASYAPEFPLPSDYPSPLDFTAPTGVDPVSSDLTAAYGEDIYQMHWLLDNDNFYGYGNRGDGVSTPSYINTFQRGEQESVYETIPHPSWESFDWGGERGFLPLFILDANYAEQWRYTSAPDADARAVQAMYWAKVYAEEQGASLENLDLDKAVKMGDYLRLAMFDKYFKPIGVQSAATGAGTGYDSAHYLMSWYMSWGGAADTSSPWAFRISSSHCHFGYQNPIAAYALTQVDEFKPQSQNGERDWNESLQRQMEFYTWLQSAEGGIAGGATNSWNGDYSPYPAGKSTFYGLAYDNDPVYHDPGSGTWFGWQAWSMERVAEYYYITNDPMAKNLMDKWTSWVKSEVQLIGDNDFRIPATLEWSGQPDTWDANNPGDNAGLSVTVTDYNADLGIAASMAKALIYYAAATEKHATLDTDSRDLAKEVLDRMWVTYRDDKGLSSPESRGDFARIFEEEVFVPTGFSGVMGNGDVIEPGVSFLDIRSDLKDDPEFDRLEAAYNAGEDYTQNYHRTWAQMEIALANAEYGFFFAENTSGAKTIAVDALEIVASPNPVRSVLRLTSVQSMKGVALRVADITGKIVHAKTIQADTKSYQVDMEHWAQGMYLINTFDPGDPSTSKVYKILKTDN